MSLQGDKDDIRRDIIADAAPGVVGVGIDYFHSKLLVFNIRSAVAEPYLRHKFGEDFFNQKIWLRSGQIHSSAPSLRSRSWMRRSRLTGAIASSGDAAPVASLMISPGSDITPMPGEPGVVGCFVLLTDGNAGALTVQHIFLDLASADICLGSNSNCTDKIGVLRQVGGLKAGPGVGNVNLADCAMFAPQNVQLKSTAKFSGEFIDKGDLQDTAGAKVLNIASSKDGYVLDPDAMIVYTVYVGGGKSAPAIFDHQILIEGQDFGFESYSGSPVVLANTISRSSKKGDLPKEAAVGLYSAILGTGMYHFATPVHACLDNPNLSADLKVRSVKYP